jgi:hypothetical protein
MTAIRSLLISSGNQRENDKHLSVIIFAYQFKNVYNIRKDCKCPGTGIYWRVALAERPMCTNMPCICQFMEE